MPVSPRNPRYSNRLSSNSPQSSNDDSIGSNSSRFNLSTQSTNHEEDIEEEQNLRSRVRGRPGIGAQGRSASKSPSRLGGAFNHSNQNLNSPNYRNSCQSGDSSYDNADDEGMMSGSPLSERQMNTKDYGYSPTKSAYGQWSPDHSDKKSPVKPYTPPGKENNSERTNKSYLNSARSTPSRSPQSSHSREELYPTSKLEEMEREEQLRGISKKKFNSKGVSKDKEDNPNNANNVDYWQLWIGGGILFIILSFLLFAFLTMLSSKEMPATSLSKLEIFHKKMTEIKANFPTQTSKTWTVSTAAIKSVMHENEPAQPAVLLLGTAKGQRHFADCIARHLANSANEAFNSTELKAGMADVELEYKGLSSGEAKLKLDEQLKENFKGGSSAFTILGLEGIDGATALLLHNYCDNENAPHKRAVIVLTIETTRSAEELYQSNSQRQAENSIEGDLEELWMKKLNYDDSNALLSRVANNIVIIKPEADETYQNLCQF